MPKLFRYPDHKSKKPYGCGPFLYGLPHSSNVYYGPIDVIERGGINTAICTLKALADVSEIEAKELLDFQ